VCASSEDITINGIENAVTAYLNYVWNGLSFLDYVTFLRKKPNSMVKEHSLYKGYRPKEYTLEDLIGDDKSPLAHEYAEKKLKEIEDAFWIRFLKLEQEKLFYFILAYSQTVVLVKTGEKDAEKRFLGYEFSNRRGYEGIHPIERDKRIEDCTRLFDDTNVDNPEKASAYIYRAFNGDVSSLIVEELKNNVFRFHLIDMMTFDRNTFEKNISLAAKKSAFFEHVWKANSLVNLGEIAEIRKGTSITKAQTQAGDIPVVAGGQDIAYYHNVSNRDGNVITVSASGAYAGFVNYFEKPIFASDCNTVQSINESVISTKLIYHYLKLMQIVLYAFGRGQAQPHVYANDIANIKIPLLQKKMQEKILVEMGIMEKKEQEAVNNITLAKNQIERDFEDAYKKANVIYKLSNSGIFDIFIGKRVIEAELTENGEIPVYSANVLEPFGCIGKYFITDFNIPSVLWGIDGDWMVNYLGANQPFYPTDHCGILRVKAKDILPRYLAWVLDKEGKKQGFSRNLRASIDRIKGLNIKVPPLKEQQKLVSEIEKLETTIQDLQKHLDQYSVQKELILKKYL
jgi:type I restriction enzyme M protein